MQTLTRVTLATVGAALLTIPMVTSGTVHSQTLTEAPAGFDGLSNGFVTQAQFEADREVFDETETVDDGLGPVFNMASCGACHGNPVSGGISPVTEERAGHFNGTAFVPHPGDSLIHSSAINAGIQEQVRDGNEVRTFRTSLNTLGDGFVECVDNNTILDIANAQPQAMRGESVRVPIAEGIPGQTEVGRFGWKAQHATLLSFGADAYRNEMGITNELFSQELAVGVPADRMRACDLIPDIEDRRDPRTGRRGIDNFASFMKLLAPVGRGPVGEAARLGEQMFTAVGCPACHTAFLETGPSGNPLFHHRRVPLYSDLLLHDIGTGDGIAQGVATPEEIRTPALWGLRFRRPYLHDGSAATLEETISRHANEADLSRRGYERATESDRAALLAFLRSL
jgi:CxxC motif-containing protein (DUF1111 family)